VLDHASAPPLPSPLPVGLMSMLSGVEFLDVFLEVDAVLHGVVLRELALLL
jgi:hypothetical protein